MDAAIYVYGIDVNSRKQCIAYICFVFLFVFMPENVLPTEDTYCKSPSNRMNISIACKLHTSDFVSFYVHGMHIQKLDPLIKNMVTHDEPASAHRILSP